jgi:hypothetical protein
MLDLPADAGAAEPLRFHERGQGVVSLFVELDDYRPRCPRCAPGIGEKSVDSWGGFRASSEIAVEDFDDFVAVSRHQPISVRLRTAPSSAFWLTRWYTH